MTLNEAFAARVKELLKEKKITQYKLGQRTGLYPSTKASNFKTMALIIRELGVTISEFFDSPVFDLANLDIE